MELTTLGLGLGPEDSCGALSRPMDAPLRSMALTRWPWRYLDMGAITCGVKRYVNEKAFRRVSCENMDLTFKFFAEHFSYRHLFVRSLGQAILERG